MRLKGEIAAAFSAFSSMMVFCFIGAGGAVLGSGDGNMFLPSWIRQKTHQRDPVRTQADGVRRVLLREKHTSRLLESRIVGDLAWMVGALTDCVGDCAEQTAITNQLAEVLKDKLSFKEPE